jgi:hypothetical protein
MLMLLLLLAPARSGRAEPVLYPLSIAAGLFWEITISGDDGLTSDSETIISFSSTDVDAWMLGDRVGIVSPIFTPSSLLHFVDREAVPGQLGVIPTTLDVSAWLEWSPPSGPALSPGQGGPMETGDASDAVFRGMLATSLGDVPFDLGLADHVGGDMALRRFDGATDAGPPRLFADTVVDPLDMLEVDEEEQPGRIEMRSPYQAVLGTFQSLTEAGSVSYALDTAAGMSWTITLTASDGQTSASETFTTFCIPPVPPDGRVCLDLDTSMVGDTVGIVDPRFTPSGVAHTIDLSSVGLTVGSIGVTLDLAAALQWTPPSGPTLVSGQSDVMGTGNATSAAFVGTLSTTLGDVPFDVGLVDHVGGDMTLRRFDAAVDSGPPRLQLDTFAAPLDRLELDENDQPGRIEMRAPYEAVLGSSGSVTWSITAEVVFNDVVYALEPGTPNGVVRDVTWTVESELLFNDVFYAPEPSAHAMLAAALPLLAALARRRARRP